MDKKIKVLNPNKTIINSGTTGKALQVNQNSNEATHLFEDKNAEILEEDDKKKDDKPVSE